MGGLCQPCENAGQGLMWLKVAATMAAQTGFLLFLYLRFNRPNPSGGIIFGSFVTFLQILQALYRIPLLWPGNLRTFLNLLRMLTIPGVLSALEFRLECLAGNDYHMMFWLETLSPLSLFAEFGALYVFARVTCNSLNLDFVLNIIGLVFGQLFVAIAGMTLKLFLVDKMPNGKPTVKAVPELELGSVERQGVLPIGLASFCIYNVSYFVVVAHAVWVAPHRVTIWPGFPLRYRFAFGALRPNRWWWAIMKVFFGLCVSLPQVTSKDTHTQLYMTSIAFIIVAIVQYELQPLKFIDANRVDLSLKLAVITFLVFSTSFVEVEQMPTGELSQNRNHNGDLALGVVVMACLVVFVYFVRWLVLAFFSPSGSELGRKAQFVFLFRDVMAVQALMSDAEVMQNMVQLGDTDLQQMDKSMRAIVGTFLREQPGRGFHQRMIPSSPYTVWRPHATTARVAQCVETGEMDTQMRKNVAGRIALARLAVLLLGEPDVPHSFASSIKRDLRFMAKQMNLDKRKPLTALEFSSSLRRLDHRLSDSDLNTVFNLLDFNGDGAVSIEEFCIVMDSLATPEYIHALTQLSGSWSLMSWRSIQSSPSLVGSIVENSSSQQEDRTEKRVIDLEEQVANTLSMLAASRQGSGGDERDQAENGVRNSFSRTLAKGLTTSSPEMQRGNHSPHLQHPPDSHAELDDFMEPDDDAPPALRMHCSSVMEPLALEKVCVTYGCAQQVVSNNG